MFLVRTHPVARGIKIGSNQPPQWQSVPTPSFVLGTASNYPPSGTYQSNSYVTDANGDVITITWVSGSISGVTWDGGRFVYDGFGSAGTTGSLVLRANDGVDVTDSTAFSIEIVSNLAWSSTPQPSFVEASLTPFNLGAYVTNYNSSTDVFTVTTGYSLPLWLSLAGTGGASLTPNGTQVDADDVDVITNPIRITVTRSGGTAVSSSSFGVTVTAPVSYGSIDDFAFEGLAVMAAWTDPQGSGTSSIAPGSSGKHSNLQYCPADQKIYVHGGDGGYPGAAASSGSVHSFRYTINAQKTNLTFDLFYPYWGQTGVDMIVGAGCNNWTWDTNRGCFWTIGGFHEGAGWMGASAFLVGTPKNSDAAPLSQSLDRIWRFHVTGAAGTAGTWERMPAASGWPIHLEGQAGLYHPPSDCLLSMKNSDSRLWWYHCATGTTGNVQTGRTTVESVEHEPNVWDSETDELIYQDVYNGGGIFAVALSGWSPLTTNTARTTRTLWTGYESGGVFPGYAQHPLFIRGSGSTRKLYTFCIPALAAGPDEVSQYVGNGLGFYELDLTTLEMRQASQPSFVLYNPLSTQPNKITACNEGAYSPAADVLVTSNKTQGSVGYSPCIFKWTAPTWTPAAGNVSALTTDYTGVTTNTYESVRPGTGSWTGGGIYFAWLGGCYAKDLSTNGMAVFQGGGDGDYFGNELIGFDFDSRRWVRLSDPASMMTGGGTSGVITDRAAAPTASNYWNRGECEHGPDPTQSAGWSNTTTGLLPAGTQPGVPHLYDGLMWLPGEIAGNRRGFILRPHTQIVYLTDGTGRAHYYDLDWNTSGVRNGWGRYSSNKGGPAQNPLIAGQTPISALDKDHPSGPRIYHAYGYLDCTTRQHTNRTWTNRGAEASTCFDPERRLWIMPYSQSAGGTATSSAPGTLLACAVDSSSTFVEPTFSFAAKQPGPGTSVAWLRGEMWQGGIEYFDELDCYFVYNCGSGDPLKTPTGVPYATRQKIWKIQPPSIVVGQPSSYYLSQPWTVTEITMPGVSVAANMSNGTYGKFMRVPPLKSLAFFNGGSMYLYKPEGV